MNFKLIVTVIEMPVNNAVVFNEFFLMEETTGNCFKSNYNAGNGYLVASVRKDSFGNLVVNGEIHSFENSLKGYEKAVNKAKCYFN